MPALTICTLLWYRNTQAKHRRAAHTAALDELMFAHDESGRLANDEPALPSFSQVK